ncbi:potassium transporter Kup [Phenylobacterium sp.]|jgi:KUP system potassium uptake protein|uniref:potassium transporter Kup n=1 Tax=Phenylobacterium sp. TaxID=1871053 RepID=UPI0025F42909|nr:potassium transporter Kup [Phenylobacterium sp.]MCA3719935.1 potassium transporter Kup [Phenylobacterium sp.]
MADAAESAGGPHTGGGDPHGGRPEGLAALTLGALGVVFGDIGTSPLYAMREALAHSRADVSAELSVLGVVSLITWALILVVTLKYVALIMRADNKGEGGTLALMALAQRALKRRSGTVLLLGMAGAALFYGDSVITPAISVLGAVEGLRDAPGVSPELGGLVLPIAAAILIVLFLVQSRGTATIAKAFGPITLAWFVILGALGVYHIFDSPSVLRGLLPHYGVIFLMDNGFVGFVILGSVFLAVTGAEALYADMGHFGKAPIRAGWLAIVLPALVLNYLGQGAMVLDRPEMRDNPFFGMVPTLVYWPVLLMAAAASVIASQAVISGAFSVTQQAVQLGLLPRIDIRRTSETQAGQIYVPQVNTFLMVGVILLLLTFQTSSNLAAAYGIAVTGSMFVDTLLFFVIIRYLWKKPLWVAVLATAGFGALDLVFMSSNLLKLAQGAWLPLLAGALMVVIMWTWSRGTRILAEKTRRDSVALGELIDMLQARPPHRASGAAIFLTSDADVAPVALMHNLKHNKVLHERNIILTVLTAQTPRVRDEERIRIEPVNDDFKKLTVSYGFMESPNIPKALTLCRQQGLKFDIMATSFFLGRRSVVPSASSGMPLWQDKLFIFLMRNAANPTDFFRIPPGRVVELGTQVTV